MTRHTFPYVVYAFVWIVLLFLTGLTVWAASFDLGRLNIAIALAIATTKASLVALFFMHLKLESRVTFVYILLALFALSLFIGLSLLDSVIRV